MEHPDSGLGTLLNKKGRITGKDVISNAKSGNTLAIDAIERLGYYLGIAISSLAPIFSRIQSVLPVVFPKLNLYLLMRLKNLFIKMQVQNMGGRW